MVSFMVTWSSGCNYPFEVESVETACLDGIDDDGDGLTDCDDPDCTDDPGCENLTEDCQNAIDDDGDGLTDCDDTDCMDDPSCEPAKNCADGIDDDGDGLTDCDDPDCSGEWYCDEPQPCNEDDVCDPFEDPFWCADCCPNCDLDEGSTYDYIATEVVLPLNEDEAKNIGVDLDGDGDIDNALGGITGAFPPDTGDFNSEINDAIINGEYIMLGRLVVSDWNDDDAMAAQVFKGSSTLDATEDNLTGSGNTLISPGVNRSLKMCGEMDANHMSTCPAPIEVPLYFMEENVSFPLEKARLVSQGPVSETGWQDMMLGGGLTQESVDGILLPALLVYLNIITIDDPTSPTGNFVLSFLDATCSQSFPGCSEVVNDEGDCSEWSGDPQDAPLTLTELQCNVLIRNFVSPDWDSDGDGEPDLLSIGMKIQAIPITIDN